MKLKLTMLSLLTLILIGCSAPPEDKSLLSDNNKSGIPKFGYEENSVFKIINQEEIDDGTVNGMIINIIVHRETRVMYMQSIKFQAGYGLSTELMVNTDGSPMIFEGDL